MAQKRDFEEFRKDASEVSKPSRLLPEPHPRADTSSPASALIPTVATRDHATTLKLSEIPTESNPAIWEVAESKKSKKKNKKKKKAAKQEDDDAPACLNMSTPPSSPLRIKDLQSLVLYILADGVAPQWIAVRQAKKINQIVVLMIPGMDRALLESFVLNTATKPASIAQNTPLQESSNAIEPSTAMTATFADAEITDSDQSPEPQSMPSLHIIPVKAPGDKVTGRFYSPLQAMLISPEPKLKSSNHRKQDAFTPTETPIAHFVHTADELVFAEYPVHPALFTNTEDQNLEKSRRQSTGQGPADGWLNSNVESAIPHIQEDAKSPNPLTGGLQVYAMDCEMVLTTDEKYSLARISVLNWFGKTIVDKYVKPSLPIKDYFTQFSGITPQILEGVTTTLEDIQKELLSLLTPNVVLVGHSLESDLNALKLTHPFVVDTSLLYPHPRGLPLRSSLKFLANKYLKREIQNNTVTGHDSVDDSRAALDLVRLKCEKGPNFGVADANGESIFSRLARFGRTSAMVDFNKPEKGFGRCATKTIGCENDDEVMGGLLNTLAGDKGDATQVSFIWAQLRAMERSRSTISGHQETASQAILARLNSIYEALPASTVLIVYPGPGDASEVRRLQEMHNQYKKEFKVKKWDELSVQWTDNEAQALRKAFDAARQGSALVGIK